MKLPLKVPPPGAKLTLSARSGVETNKREKNATTKLGSLNTENRRGIESFQIGFLAISQNNSADIADEMCRNPVTKLRSQNLNDLPELSVVVVQDVAL